MRILASVLIRVKLILFLALVNGTCSIDRSNREDCLTKNGLKIESIQKCIAKECCFEVDQLTQDLKCFKPKGKISSAYFGSMSGPD